MSAVLSQKAQPFLCSRIQRVDLDSETRVGEEEVGKGRHVSSGIPALTGGTSRRAVSSRPTWAADIVTTSHTNRTGRGR